MVAEPEVTYHTEMKALSDMEATPQTNIQVTPPRNTKSTSLENMKALATGDMDITPLAVTKVFSPASTESPAHTN